MSEPASGDRALGSERDSGSERESDGERESGSERESDGERESGGKRASDAERASGSERESGDRSGFLGRLRAALAAPMPVNVAHPLPPPVDAVPPVVHTSLDPDDLVGTFEQAAKKVAAVVHRVHGDEVPESVLEQIVTEHGVERAVVSREAEAAAIAGRLSVLGVTVEAVERSAAAAADLGVTSAVAGIAATGSVVVDSATSGRMASLLPRVHLCVLPASRIVATPSDVLRPLTGHRELLPSNLVIITGPSRTGDIEQLITLGVHGPVAVHIVVLER